ncbi:hypothetical protein EJD97_012154, partial [Solanum chilense]
MALNLANERFRPPDPPLGDGNPTIQSTIHEVAETASSSSSQRKEEAVHVATVEAKIDASRHNLEKGHNMSGHNTRGHEGEIQKIDSLQQQQSNQNIQKNQRIFNLNKETEVNQQFQHPTNIHTRSQGAKSTVLPSNSRQAGESSSDMPIRSEIGQGNTTLTNFNSKNDGLLNDSVRINNASARNHDYHNNFPTISTNFDNPVHRNIPDKIDIPPGNANNFPKRDHIPEPAPYTVIQTYADRLRFNQSKRGVSIKLSDPEITTKQGLPAVLYVKEEVVKDLASTCKFTLIGKFIYTMPRVDLIRKEELHSP